MRNFSKTILVFIASSSCLISTRAFAHDGTRGGGDLQCDRVVRKTFEKVETWVNGGGAQVGELDLSSTRTPLTGRNYTIGEYEIEMKKVMSLPLVSGCVSPGDRQFPLTVKGIPKTCVTFVGNGNLNMVCDAQKFLNMSADRATNQDLQIEQIHHEVAINVSGLEIDRGPISTYKVSTQLAAFTVDVLERRLAVMPRPRLQDVPRNGLTSLAQLPTDGSDSNSIYRMQAYILHPHAGGEPPLYELTLPGACGDYDGKSLLQIYIASLEKDFVQTLSLKGFHIANYQTSFDYQGTDDVEPFQFGSSVNNKPFTEPYGDLTIHLTTVENVGLTAKFWVQRAHGSFWRTTHRSAGYAYYSEPGYGVLMETNSSIDHDDLGRVTQASSTCKVNGAGLGVTVTNDDNGFQVY